MMVGMMHQSVRLKKDSHAPTPKCKPTDDAVYDFRFYPGLLHTFRQEMKNQHMKQIAKPAEYLGDCLLRLAGHHHPEFGVHLVLLHS